VDLYDIGYFYSDMSKSRNTAVQFDGKGGNLYLCLRQGHTQFVWRRMAVLSFNSLNSSRR
jgi:hypothetical protein